MAQFMQVAISNRFQEYMTDFSAENKKSPLLEPGIKEATLPIRLVVAPKDLTCTLTQGYRIYKEYGGEVNFTKVGPDADHEYFLSSMDTPEFLTMIRDELTDTEFSSAFAVSAASAIIATITAMSF